MVNRYNKDGSLNRLKRNDRAETGIGTLIVFIAMILVAAVAAGVLVRTSTNLQEQAESTGDDAKSRVSTALETVGVFGQRNATTTSLIDNVTIHVQLSSGSPALDLDKLRIRWSDGTNTPREMSYAASGVSNATFTAESLRDTDGSFTTATPVVNGNDLVKITIKNVYLTPRTAVSLYMVPEGGVQSPVLFTTPNTYTETWMTLA